MADEKSCFVIAPIGEPESDTRKRSDQVLKHVIRPAVEALGYRAIRADEIDKPGMITSQVIQHIVNDPLVIADLTDRNPNVFYELAIRHALRKPLVQIIKKGESIPFDVAGARTIYVDHKDLDSVEDAKSKITEQIRALEIDASDMETPISVSLDLQVLRQSEKPEERSLADLLAAVSELRGAILKIEQRTVGQDASGSIAELHNKINIILTRFSERASGWVIGGFDRESRVTRARGYQELMRADVANPTSLGLLVLISGFRDTVPWVYELGVGLYQEIDHGDPARAIKVAREFRQVLHASVGAQLVPERHQPDWFELMGLVDELLERLDRSLARGKPSTPARPTSHHRPRPPELQ